MVRFRKVLCHAEFHRYAPWHNLAVAVTRCMRLPVYVLHYETYETGFTRTYNDLFFFLEWPREGKVPEFVAGKKYDGYFTEEERREGMNWARMVAEPETWELLEAVQICWGSTEGKGQQSSPVHFEARQSHSDDTASHRPRPSQRACYFVSRLSVLSNPF